jgi:hypothetical protein
MSDVLIPSPGLPGASAPRGVRAPVLEPSPVDYLGMAAEGQEDGSVVLTPPTPRSSGNLRERAWGENFAEHLSDTVLGQLSTEVIEGYEADVASNQELYKTLEEGIEALGLKKERLDMPFKGAAGARSSLMLKAAMRFGANALGEMLPAAGPVRMQVQGQAEGIDEAALRKAKFLNHHLTSVDEGYYPDFDQGLFLLGVLGSIFRMVYRDPVSGQPRSRYRTPFNLVVSYHASDAHGSGRFTEVDKLPGAEVKRLQVLGHYRQVAVPDPYSEDEQDPAGVLRAQEGRQASDRPEDAEHTIITQRVITTIPGLEHLGEDGEPSGLPLPWRVVVDLDSRDVLRIDRDWDPKDRGLRPREHFSHFRYAPGLGYYGLGFAQLLASAQDATTMMVRQGLNANTLVSFPGGLRVKGQRLDQSDMAIGPCEFREVDTGGLPIQQAVLPLPYRDVPASFVPLLQHLNGEGEQLGSVAEMQVGEGRQDAPVGTTLALIEQAVRVESAVIKRLHAAQRKELRLLAGLFAEDRSAVYPFLVDGKPDVPIGPDFERADDIVPVSDPNIPTQVQRLTLAQAKLSLAQANPGMYDLRAANEMMLRVAGADESEIKRLMPPAPQGVPSDPISELAFAIKGQPLAVHPAQLHEAHIAAHMAQAQMPGLPPPIAQSLVAHIGEHVIAYARAQASLAAGAPLPPVGAPVPPQVEQAISMLAAQVMGPICEKLGPLLAGGADADPVKAAELRIKEKELAFKAEDSVRKSQESARQDAGEAMRDSMQFRQHQDEMALAREEMAHEDRQARIQAASAIAVAERTPQAGLGGPARPKRGGA